MMKVRAAALVDASASRRSRRASRWRRSKRCWCRSTSTTATRSKRPPSVVGGLHYIYALRGGNTEPVRFASAAEQQQGARRDPGDARAVGAGAAAAAAEDASRRGRADTGRRRELFPRYTGQMFDAITPAVIAADLTLGFLLDEARAARLVEQNALDRIAARAARRDRPRARGDLRAGAGGWLRGGDPARRPARRGRTPDDAGRRAPTCRRCGRSRPRKLQGARRATLAAAARRPAAAHGALLAADIKRFLERPAAPATPDRDPGAAARRADRRAGDGLAAAPRATVLAVGPLTTPFKATEQHGSTRITEATGQVRTCIRVGAQLDGVGAYLLLRQCTPGRSGPTWAILSGMPIRIRLLGSAFVFALLLSAAPLAQRPREAYDYWRAQRAMIARGQQAIFMCNGLFTSNRTLEQVFAQELKFLREPIGTPAGGDYVVDRTKRAVAVGKDDGYR